MSMAARKALSEGDIENFIVAMTPGGIVAQEKRGQAQFVASDSLPKEIEGITRPELVEIGFVFGEDIDELFVECRLPEGWSKRPTDHDMWSELLDGEGVQRAMIFYKAAFYDRRAQLTWSPAAGE